METQIKYKFPFLIKSIRKKNREARKMELERGGLVVGGSHAEGKDVHFVLEDTGTHIVAEGEEAVIPNTINNIAKIYTFTGKNHEVVHRILQLIGLKLSDKVTSIRSGDLVICKASLWDDKVRTYTGTPIQILSAVNESEACNSFARGATVTEIKNNNGQDKLSNYYKKS
jgi:hypothetical protein